MATGITTSPKEYSIWIANESTAGTSALHASNMYQLDVDSIGFPTLNVNQTVDVKTGLGRTLKDEDFFQDNKVRVTELSLSGTLHNDAGHLVLLRNVCTSNSGDITVASGYQPPTIKYGAANTTAGDTFTIVVKGVDPTVGAGVALDDSRNFVLKGCVCTNFAISADMGTEGGRYKFTATVQTGFVPDFNDTTARNAIGSNAYANTTDTTLASASGHEVLNSSVIMNSFTCTVDNPATFIGATANGFDVVNRGSEIAVTVDTQIKLDDETKTFVNAFDTQSAFNGTDSFVVVNSANYGVEMENAVITNVAYSEGDVMMLDCSLKAVDDGSEPLVTIDVA
tara:strand:- start:2193 stop:3209 length:1017 start_codon:yes stop_codon:yes gene_type:complete